MPRKISRSHAFEDAFFWAAQRCASSYHNISCPKYRRLSSNGKILQNHHDPVLLEYSGEAQGILPGKEWMRMARLSTYFSLEGTGDPHDAKRLKRELDTLPGVTSVSVSDSGRLAVDYDSTGVRQEEIRQKVRELGFWIRETE